MLIVSAKFVFISQEVNDMFIGLENNCWVL